MKSLISMSVNHSVTYVTFCHKLQFKCICEAKLSFCGSVPHYNFVDHDFYIRLMSKKVFEKCLPSVKCSLIMLHRITYVTYRKSNFFYVEFKNGIKIKHGHFSIDQNGFK